MKASLNETWGLIALSVAVPSGLAGLFLGAFALVTAKGAADERRLINTKVRETAQVEVSKAFDGAFERLNARVDRAVAGASSESAQALQDDLSALQALIEEAEARLSGRIEQATFAALAVVEEPETETPVAVSFDLPAEIQAALSVGNVDKGKGLTRFCSACHSFDAGGGNKTGPALYGVFGRAAASVDGFAYSKAMDAFDQPWSIEALDAYLAKPTDFMPGTKMVFPGLRKEEWRRDVIAYLATLRE